MKRHSLLIDLRNQGKSDHHKDHSYSAMADDIVRLLDRLKINKATIMGYSTGAKVAYATACKHPSRTEGVIAIDHAPLDFNIHYTNEKDFFNNFQYRLGDYQILHKSKSQV